MKTKVLFLSLVLFTLCNSTDSFGQYTWTQKTNFGGSARYSVSSFVIGNKGYVGTGHNGTLLRDFWEYDPVTNAWTQKANFGGIARYGATSFSLGSKGYIGLGRTAYPGSGFGNDLWEYDPSLNTWVQKANFPGSLRFTSVSFSIGMKGYVGTGYNGALLKDFWEYDATTNAWTQKTSFGGTNRQSASGFAINGKGYLGTGYDGSNRNDLWEYNPTTNAWTQKANFGGQARFGATAFDMNGAGYIGLGENINVMFHDFWKYDPTANSWTLVGTYPGSPGQTVAATSFSIGCKAYVGTGSDLNTALGTFTNEFWELSTPVNASFTASINSLCGSGPVTLTNNSSGAQGILWDFGDGTTSVDTNKIITHTYLSSGNYYVKLIATNACGSDTDSTLIAVHPLPILTVTNDTVICAGSTVSLTVIGAATYQWSPATGLSSTNVSTVNATPTVATTYTVTGTDLNGCVSTGTVDLGIMPLAQATIAPVGSISMCGNAPITLTNNSVNATAVFWNFGDSMTSTDTSHTITHTYASSGNYTVKLMASNACGSDTDSISIAIHALPVLSLTPDTTICSGASVSLSVSGASAYQWSPATGLSATSGNNVVATPASDIVYLVTGTDTNGCTSSDTVHVYLAPMPLAAITPSGSVSICGTNSITLSASTGSGNKYEWYMNGVLISGATASQLAVSTPGIYTVKITNNFGCSTLSSATTVTVGSSNLTVTVLASPTIGCESNTIYLGYGPQSVTLTASAANAVSYLWSTGETTASISVTSPGTYYVQVRDSSGCVSDTTPQSQVSVKVIDARCGNGLKKVLLCHVPPGNHSNPQSLCISPQAVATHLSNHPEDCLGSCDSQQGLRLLSSTGMSNGKYMVMPTAFAESTSLIFLAEPEDVTVNVYDFTGRLIESLKSSGKNISFGNAWKSGIYSLEIIAGESRELIKVVKIQ